MTDEYQRGYNAGYVAGRRRRAEVVYRKQGWRCAACGAIGFVLFRSDDDERKKRFRIEQSHRAQKNVRRCPNPRLGRLTKREAARNR